MQTKHRLLRILFFSYALLFALSIHQHASAQETAPNEVTRIYYVNGVNNTLLEATRSSLRLEEEINPLIEGNTENTQYIHGVSYNYTQESLTDIAQALQQKLIESNLDFSLIYLLNQLAQHNKGELSRIKESLGWPNGNLKVVSEKMISAIQFIEDNPELFEEIFADEWAAANVDRQVVDFKLRETYLDNLNDGERVLLVAHSQGNLFANQAINTISERYPCLAPSIGVVGVATPAGALLERPEGSTLAFNPYVTADDDLVIDALRQLTPFPVLPGNVINRGSVAADSRDFMNHNFIAGYLAEGLPSRTEILEGFEALNDDLLFPECEGVVTITSPQENQSFAANDTITVGFTSNAEFRYIQVFFNDVLFNDFQLSELNTSGEGEYSFDLDLSFFQPVPGQNYEIEVIIFDEFNVDLGSGTVTVAIEGESPLQITTPSESAVVDIGSKLRVNFTVDRLFSNATLYIDNEPMDIPYTYNGQIGRFEFTPLEVGDFVAGDEVTLGVEATFIAVAGEVTVRDDVLITLDDLSAKASATLHYSVKKITLQACPSTADLNCWAEAGQLENEFEFAIRADSLIDLQPESVGNPAPDVEISTNFGDASIELDLRNETESPLSALESETDTPTYQGPGTYVMQPAFSSSQIVAFMQDELASTFSDRWLVLETNGEIVSELYYTITPSCDDVLLVINEDNQYLDEGSSSVYLMSGQYSASCEFTIEYVSDKVRQSGSNDIDSVLRTITSNVALTLNFDNVAVVRF